MNKEKRRKLELALLLAVTIVMFSVAFITLFLVLDILNGLGEVALQEIATIKAAENMTYPHNETRAAMATSRIALAFSLVNILICLLVFLFIAAIYVGLYYLGWFIGTWKRTPTTKERLEELIRKHVKDHHEREVVG